MVARAVTKKITDLPTYTLNTNQGNILYNEGGVNYQYPITNFTLKSDLISTDLNKGTTLIALKQGGSLTNAIPEFFVDAFGADPSGLTDSTQAFIKTISAATGGNITSNFSKTQTTYAKIILGKGHYQVNNVPIPSGVTLCGQGQFATLVYPTEYDGWVFTTTGVTASVSDPEQRLAGSELSDMTVGCGYWTEDLYSRPSGTGGIRILSGTYLVLRNLNICRLDGGGLRLEGGWDSDSENIKIIKCGSGTTVDDAVPGLYIGNGVTGSVSDPSNQMRFRGLHIENCPQNFYIDNDTRHITLESPKIESSEVSIRIPSIIGGVRALTFNSPGLTWQYQDAPMIRILNTQPHYGVTFNNPRPISATTSMGWYFDHLSTQMPLALNGVCGFAVWKLISGRNFKINGGELMNCGPCIVDGTSDISIVNFNAIVSLAATATDGTHDAIRVNGGNILITNSNLYCAGTVTDGSAAIYVGASCSNPIIKNNAFRGTKNYGIRVVTGATISPNLLVDNTASSTYGAVVYGSSTRYTVTARGNSGFGQGQITSVGPFTIDSGSSYTGNVIAGGSDILIKTTSTSGVTCGKFFADYSSTALNTISTINGIKTGTGVASDGYIYVTKSGTSLTITNYTALQITVYLTVISAQA